MSTPDYDSDFYAWTQQQAAAIRAGQWEAIDREHVAEEIADLWHQDRHDSAMLALGFLELAYGACADEIGQYYWQSAVVDHHRGMLRLSLKESPQLRLFLRDRLPDAYTWAREQLLKRRTPPRQTPPEVCPWTFDDLVNYHYWPLEAPARLP